MGRQRLSACSTRLASEEIQVLQSDEAGNVGHQYLKTCSTQAVAASFEVL